MPYEPQSDAARAADIEDADSNALQALSGEVQNDASKHNVTRRVSGALPLPQMSFNEMLAMGDHLVKTGFLPFHIKNGAQAAAIMLAGRELGMQPMRSLRSLQMVEGKISESADSQLGRFKVAGGQARFLELSQEKARLWLRHPNGDEHTEEFTHSDVMAAGLDKDTRNGKTSNHIKYPKAMKRSRAITAGLKSIGWDGAVDVYDADELIEADDMIGLTLTRESSGEDAAPLPPRSPLRSLGGRDMTQEQQSSESAPAAPQTAGAATAPDPDSEPPTDKQRALLERLTMSHLFTDKEREAARALLTKKRVSKAIEYAQEQIGIRRKAEQESEARAKAAADAALAEPDVVQASLLDEDEARVGRDALREGL